MCRLPCNSIAHRFVFKYTWGGLGAHRTTQRLPWRCTKHSEWSMRCRGTFLSHLDENVFLLCRR